MKKNLLLFGMGLLIITGCSHQPNLENAKETNATKQSTKEVNSTTSNENNIITKTQADTESVSTENADVETQSIAIKVSKENNNEDFAKKLSKIIIYFDFDKYNIRDDQMPKVEELAKLLKENSSNYTVRIEGNCDEWGSEEYNYALGLKRANSVKNALIRLGVDPKKLTVISYGELNPVCTAHARWCWRKNRRDNFTYLP